LDDAAKLLLKAAVLIEERGWCQHEAKDTEGRLCVHGALYYANNESVNDLLRASADRFDASLPPNMLTPQWNDMPCRIKDEVVAKLRAVALGG